MTNTVDPDGGNGQHSPSCNLTVDRAGSTWLQDFGYRDLTDPNTIGGTIWEDRDADGTLDAGETGRFAGVTVVLKDSSGDIVATTTTDSSGNY